MLVRSLSEILQVRENVSTTPTSRNHSPTNRTTLIGLSGAQGSGKSTLAAGLAAQLASELSDEPPALSENTPPLDGSLFERPLFDRPLSVAVLSIDDVYLTKKQRAALAAAPPPHGHPLLVTRGVPGTHDLPLAHATLDALIAAKEGDATPLPRFDKTRDDRFDPADWPVHHGRCDVVILEGWCVGARPQPDDMLTDPVNALEAAEDPDGAWRRYVNAALASDYAKLWERLDQRLMLRAPSFDCVAGWRAQQEAGLDRSHPGAAPPMDSAALNRFIAHYERLTRWMIDDAPADLICDIDAGRTPLRTWWKDGRDAG